MRSSAGLSVSSVPSGLGARELRRAPDLFTEATSARSKPPSFEDVWGSNSPKPAPEHFRKTTTTSAWFSPMLAAFLAVLLGSMALVGLKEKIVRILPPSAALYASAGMPVNVRGLEFRVVKSAMGEDGAQRFLKVRGEITNLRTQSNAVPPIELVVEGADGRPLYRWTATAPKNKLVGNETVAFEARLLAPPDAGRDVRVHFAQAN
jgi:hypothetical protein